MKPEDCGFFNDMNYQCPKREWSYLSDRERGCPDNCPIVKLWNEWHLSTLYYTNCLLNQQKEIDTLKKEVEELKDGDNCPHCNDMGYQVVTGRDGEPEQEQCEWCYTNPNSKFSRQRIKTA